MSILIRLPDLPKQARKEFLSWYQPSSERQRHLEQLAANTLRFTEYRKRVLAAHVKAARLPPL